MVKIVLRIYLAAMVSSTIYCLTCGGIAWWADHQVDQKNTQQALRFYRLLGQIAPGFPDIFVWQGWRECELGNYAEAKALAEKARQRNPESAEVPALLGQVAYMEGRYQDALECWKDYPAGRAWAYYELGRLDESRQCLKQCRGDEPGLDELRKALKF